MKDWCTTLLAACLPFTAQSQFFPVNDATWCAGNGVYGQYRHLLAANPDTIIDGVVYQTVKNFRCLEDCSLWSTQDYDLLSTCFIRSTPDGKGFIREENDTLEYLIGDLGAGVGDTVRDVLILGSDWIDWEEGADRTTYDVVVDSIVQVERSGVIVTRHFVHEVTFWNPDDSSPYNFFPWRFYWQQGMGTSHGLVLRMELALGDYYSLQCATTGDSTVYSWYGFTDLPPWGFPPGGPPCCAPWDVSVTELSADQSYLISENPSTGIFRINDHVPWAITIFDAQGRQVAQVMGPMIDLSDHPPGLYTAVMNAPEGGRAVRLMVLR